MRKYSTIFQTVLICVVVMGYAQQQAPVIAGAAGIGAVTVAAGGALGAGIYASTAATHAAQLSNIAENIAPAIRNYYVASFHSGGGSAMQSAAVQSANIAERAEQMLAAIDAAPSSELASAVTTAAVAPEQAEAAVAAAQMASKIATAITVATIIITIIVMVAIETMPYWLPKILKQSGMANNTLYEARAYIDFQGAVGQACSRANFHLYPYSRKDLGGKFWQEVGGDRGRSCLPDRYTTLVYIPSCALITLKSSYHDTAKHMKLFSITPAQRGAPIAFTWQNA